MTASPTQNDPAESPTPAIRSRVKGRARMILAVNMGNTLEWFDWTVFAIFAVYFSNQFFHSTNEVSNLLSTMAVFAVGFVMRPIGGLIFGLVADRRGRKFVMVLTMTLVAASSVLIAIAPTYERIGVFASLWLLVVRCIQGVAHGGEQGGSYTYIAEVARPDNRALWGTTVIMSTVGGTVLATLLGAVMRTAIDSQAMADWGWRIPFLIGGALGFFALYLRRGLEESAAFADQAASTGTPSSARSALRDIWAQRTSILRVVLLVGGTSVFSYTWSVNAPAYAISFHHVNDKLAMWAGVVANIVFILALPLAALLADRFGRRPNNIAWGLLVALLAFPLSGMLDGSALTLVVAMSLALVIQALAASTQVAWFAELFSTKSRAAGTGIAVSLAAAIFGGTAPYLNSWLTSRGTPDLFTWYVIVLALAVAAAAYFTQETKGLALTAVTDTPSETSVSPG
ncbi:MHS family alpha-ketoglutarate permease-like MFS transporter [Rhodococcus sp. SMB37]|uniref:MFS transporter n=1 Tax=Rhodococcus sp. SMB37 TaxID=2512213 RepID=UPI0010EBF3D6|nr:MFS transporter [Rhodococcus sp. SMB37]TCN47341.1 MHS family alpha-ketoglutarate permease-like MFS transporter [Rhodococcus sp. SMB37]